MGARSEQLKGVRFGAYEIVGLVGHGATASVFEAVHVGLDKPVALKLLHEHLAEDTEITGRFLREGRVAARLDHPNIVSVLDVGTDRGVPYLVMELLRGNDLRSLLADVRILSIEHALGFLLPIAAGLAHAHEVGVIHRDLKPANVFLSRDSRDEIVPKLVDFGLSKVLRPDGGASSAPTASEVVAGTALYMAPEQTIAMKHVVPASDQYSLAAVLYEAITGEPPFSGDGVYSLLENIRTAPLRPPSLIHGGLSEALDAVILKAMNRDPAKRWPSMRAFGRELAAFAGDALTPVLQRELVSTPNIATAPSSRTESASGVSLVSRVAETRSELPHPSAETLAAVVGATPSVAPLPCAAGSSPFHIKGVSYRGFIRHVSRTIGLESFMAGLEDESVRAFVQQPFLASARYDVLPYVPLFALLARLQRVPMDMLVRVSTAAQVRYDAKTTYKRILATTRPADIAERIGRFNEQVYDFGTYRATVLDENRVTLEFQHIPAYLEPWFAPMHIAYAEESLRLAGAKDVVTSMRPPEESGTQAGYPLRTYRSEVCWR